MHFLEVRRRQSGAPARPLAAVLVMSVVLAGAAFTARPSVAGDAQTKVKGPSVLGAPPELTPDAFEPDNTPATATSMVDGQVQERTLHSDDDHDWVKITLAESATVTVRTSGADSTTDTKVFLYGPGLPDLENNSNLRRINDDDPTSENPLNYYAAVTAFNLEPGEYYALVRPFADGESAGPYTLTLDISSTLNVPADSAERFDTRARARSISIGGGPVQRTLHTGTDVDYFKLKVRRTTPLRIRTAGARSNPFGDTALTVYKGQVVKGSADNSGGAHPDWVASTYAELSITLKPGIYIIEVRGRGNVVDPGYTLEVSREVLL